MQNSKQYSQRTKDYTRIPFQVWMDKDIHQAFKIACVKNGITMNEAIINFMEEYSTRG